MKRLLSVCVLLIIIASAKAQPFLGTSFNFNSAEIQGGYQFNPDIEVTVAYKAPFVRTDIERLLSLTVGKKLWINDSYSVMSAIGLAHYSIKDFKHTDQSGNPVFISSPSPVLKIELGKNYKQGLVFILFNYCRSLSLCAGIKCYFKK